MSPHRHRGSIVLSGLVLLAAGCACPCSKKPNSAGQPLPRFARVDERLYRGGQPTLEGYRRLADLGVKTVIDLRAEDESQRAADAQAAGSLGIRWLSLPMRAYGRPTEAQLSAFLSAVDDPANQPVYVHCRQGKDRTGTLVAVYRVAEQHWEPVRAYREARSLGLTRWNPFLRYVILHQASKERPRLANLP